MMHRQGGWLWLCVIGLMLVTGCKGTSPTTAAVRVTDRATANSPAPPTATPAVAATTSVEPLPATAPPEGMVLIPAGEFQMGSESGESDEKPVHTVFLNDFYIDVYEVTNARYAECVAAGACDPPTESSSSTRSSYYGNSEYADYPVIYVTWEMASTYCEWRGGRLPTEAEWEKAARGGLEGKLYPWGDETPTCERAKYRGKDDGCMGDTSPVGSYAPNGYGLYDMAGNVWEWVQDWYLETFYDSSPRDNPTGPTSGQFRALRGGSWYDSGNYLRSANRNGYVPVDWSDYWGFRCVATVKSPE